MKNFLLSLLAIIILLSSACKKDTQQYEPEPDGVKHDVSFSVSNMNVSTSTMKNGASSISSDSLYKHARYLACNIYKGSYLVAFQRQDRNVDANFGKIAVKLQKGNYSAVFFASEGVFNLTSTNTTSPMNPQSITIPDSVNLHDVFHKRITFSVDTTPINHAIVLERFVAGISLKLTDQIPSNISKITIRVEKDQNNYQLIEGVFGDSRHGAINRTITFNLSPADKIGINKTFNSFIWNVSYPVKLIIRAYDANNSIVREKSIPNVSFYQNRITEISGNLFNIENTPGATTTFSVVVNPVWDTPTADVRF